MVAHPQCLQDKGTEGLGTCPSPSQTSPGGPTVAGVGGLAVVDVGGAAQALGGCNGFMAKTMLKTAWLVLALCSCVQPLGPLPQRLSWAYLLLTELKVVLEVEDVGRMGHNSINELLPADHDPARSKRRRCCPGVSNHPQPHGTESVAREVTLVESQLHKVCLYPWAACSEMPVPAFC